MGTISPSGTKVRTNLERTDNGRTTFLRSRCNLWAQFLQMLKYLKGVAGRSSAYFLRAMRGLKAQREEKAGRRVGQRKKGYKNRLKKNGGHFQSIALFTYYVCRGGNLWLEVHAISYRGQ